MRENLKMECIVKKYLFILKLVFTCKGFFIIFQSKPSPLQRAEHVRLTKQLEILHFKRLILSDERDSKLANIRRLKEKHVKLFEENQDIGKNESFDTFYF